MFSKTIIVGHLGRDPELRYTSGGQPVCSFSVATSRSWTDQSGQPQEKTTWFRVTAWGKLGELCNQYLTKGRLVLAEGEVDASAWSAQTGEPRASLELTARNVRFLGGKDGGGTSMGGRMGGDMGAPQIDEEEIPF
jgi:single-strand DNA-binding protein